LAAAFLAGFAGAFFTGTFLAGAFFTGAVFAGAFLAGAFFAGAFFTGAFFTGAFFAGAFFAGAFFTGAFFTGAFFAGAFLAGAFFADAFFADAFFADPDLVVTSHTLPLDRPPTNKVVPGTPGRRLTPVLMVAICCPSESTSAQQERDDFSHNPVAFRPSESAHNLQRPQSVRPHCDNVNSITATSGGAATTA
jgi:hypothetical protein